MARVMESLGENGQIDRLIGKRDLFDVAELVGEISQAIFLGELRAHLDHAGGVVDAPYPFRAIGQQLGKESFTGPEVCHGNCGYEPESEMTNRLPRTTGTMILTKAAGNQVEILFG